MRKELRKHLVLIVPGEGCVLRKEEEVRVLRENIYFQKLMLRHVQIVQVALNVLNWELMLHARMVFIQNQIHGQSHV